MMHKIELSIEEIRPKMKKILREETSPAKLLENIYLRLMLLVSLSEIDEGELYFEAINKKYVMKIEERIEH